MSLLGKEQGKPLAHGAGKGLEKGAWFNFREGSLGSGIGKKFTKRLCRKKQYLKNRH